MRALVQRVTEARVRVDGAVVGEIGDGLCVLVGVTHRDDVQMLTRLGGDIERTVLARSVIWHCEDRVLRHGNTTIVF